MKKQFLITLFISAILSSGCGPKVITDEEIAALKEQLKTIEAVPVVAGEVAILETTKGTIVFEFYPEKAPNHCANFKKLANSGFYDWTTFHRVIEGFMIQGGDINSKNANPDDDGMGSPGYNVNAEFNDIKHVPGIVSMARTNDPNGAGSQFFICHGSPSNLDGQYTVFGNVIEGLDVVKMIARTPVEGSSPIDPIYIKSAKVVTR